MLEKPKIYIIILNKNKYLHDMIQIIESQIRKTRIITFKFHVHLWSWILNAVLRLLKLKTLIWQKDYSLKTSLIPLKLGSGLIFVCLIIYFNFLEPPYSINKNL